MEALIFGLFLVGILGLVLGIRFYLLVTSTLRQVRMTQAAVHQKIQQENIARQQRSVGGTY